MDTATADAVAPDAAVATAPPVATTTAAAPSPTPNGDAEARAREALAKANAVLALRRAGLLPGSGALPREMDAKTVAAVNTAAPTFAAEGGAQFRPQLTQSVGGGSDARNASTQAPRATISTAAVAAAPAPPATADRWAGQDAWDRAPVGAMTDYVRNRPGAVGGSGVALSPATAPNNGPGFNFAVNGKPIVSSPSARATSPTTNGTVAANALIGELGPLRADESTGSIIQFLFGMRISTPFFGTGFNFCVDRYFGSFPKVGIVVPNAAAWLLPDVAGLLGPTLNATLSLPTPGAGLPKGARADPTSDGFVIWLPSIQPLYISNFGFRYGLQIAQLFGMDFGFGVLKIGCRVDFVRV